jgi:hypothetical protein
MAGETIFACRNGVAHGASGLPGACLARIVPTTVFRIDQGAAGHPGDNDCLVTDKNVAVEVWGKVSGELLGRIGQAAATMTIPIYGAAGAAQTLSALAVYFDEALGEIEIPAKDEGGKLKLFGVRGHVNFTAGQGFGDVITAA